MRIFSAKYTAKKQIESVCVPFEALSLQNVEDFAYKGNFTSFSTHKK